MRGICAVLFAGLVLVACDDGDGADAGRADAGPSVSDAGRDAGADDAGATDAGLDAGTADAGEPPPGVVIAEGVCDGVGAVDVAVDGSRYAYVTCVGDVAAWVRDHPAGAPARVDDATADSAVRLSPDAAWVLYGPSGALRIRDVGLTSPAVSVAAGTVDEARFVVASVGTATELRLVVLETDGGTRRITSRSEADGFATATTLHESADIAGSLALISGSGRTLVFETGAGAAREYRSVPTDGVSAAAILPVDPDSLVLGPVGMGDTHTIGRPADGLSFVELATGVSAPLEPNGVHPTAPIFAVVDTPGNRYAYYIRNGDITSALRDGSGAPRTHVTANASDLAYSEDGRRFFFISDGRARSAQLFSNLDVDIAPYAATTFDAAIAPGGSQIALIEGGAILTAAADAPGFDRVIDASGVVAGSAGYTGALTPELMWLRDTDEMGRLDVLRARIGPRTVAWDVDAYWVIPNAAEVLYRSNLGALRVL